MLDRDRILARLDALDSYLEELRQVVPPTFDEYRRVEKRRSCERLLQIAIEAVLDVCGLMVSGLRLGLPGEEDDGLEKLGTAGVVSTELKDRLRNMKGLRSILVHECGRVNDRLIYEALHNEFGDFERFKQEVLRTLAKAGGRS
jgi:uncharacterized protein YutE (UPF0331/DUF86 family)